MERNKVVYLHKRKDTGEVFYVGIGYMKRAYEKYHRTKYWYNIVNRYGYIVEILKTDLTWDEACEEEIRLIKLYGRKDLGLGTLVNMTDGGEGLQGFRHTKEMRKKNSQRKKGKNNPMYGKTLSKETRMKLSESHKKIVGEKTSAAKLKTNDVIFIRKNAIKGTGSKNRGNLRELAKKFNVAYSTIKSVVNRESWKHI